MLFNVGDEHVPFLRTKQLDEAAGIIPAVTRGRNPILVVGRGRIQWARNFLCEKHATSSSKKGRARPHALKSSSQQRLSGKQDKNMPSKGLLRGKQKVAGNHKSRLSKPGRGLPNVTRKPLSWLFSQASVRMTHKVIIQILIMAASLTFLMTLCRRALRMLTFLA